MTHVTSPAPRGRAFSLPGLALAGALLLAAHPASAAVITTLPEGVAQPIVGTNRPNVNHPVAFGDGVTYQAKTSAGEQASSVFGATGTYSFANSGYWSGTPYAAIGLQTAIMSFSFADPVSAALAEFNWARAPNSPALTFRAYNSAGKLLESLSFAADDPAYTTGFYGFQRASNDISRFEVEGYWVGTRNLSTFTGAVSAVPEPATWAMMIIGFGAAGAAIRRRRDAFAVA